MKSLIIFIIILTTLNSCQSNNEKESVKIISPGAWQTSEYLPMIKGKSVAVVVNQSSTIHATHLVDSLISLGVDIKAIFAPEHGFRGDADAGEKLTNSIDQSTGIPIISLYGEHRKPSEKDLDNIDIVVFDIQDVGVRFYTFISTMHYVMEACAENKKKLIILDRPNPNGYYVAGPVLNMEYQSFVGMHPVPIVYGLTMGEMAGMINNEGWLKSEKCDITVVKNRNYTHQNRYELPIKPSPNLPNARSVELYPSLCLFEPTVISIGRGTTFPFQVIGYPDSTYGSFLFLPVSLEGMSKYPKYENQNCFGEDLRSSTENIHFTLAYLLNYYEKFGGGESFFTSPSFFDKLAGSNDLRLRILAGNTAQDIENSWKTGHDEYMLLRSKYLLYEDFE